MILDDNAVRLELERLCGSQCGYLSDAQRREVLLLVQEARRAAKLECLREFRDRFSSKAYRGGPLSLISTMIASLENEAAERCDHGHEPHPQLVGERCPHRFVAGQFGPETSVCVLPKGHATSHRFCDGGLLPLGQTEAAEPAKEET